MKTAAAYIRVSTDDQVEYSPDSQLKLIREYAKRNDYILPDEFIFQDHGISGRDAAHRPAFNQMIALAKSDEHPFDSILVWKFSRFARNQEESIVIKNLLKKVKVDVRSVSEPVDADNAFGTLIERIIEWMDEYYSINLSVEVKRGMLERFTRGEILTGAPFGYKVENGVYVPHETQAPIVRRVFESFIAGAGTRRIAVNLSADGVTTNRGNKPDNRFVEYMLNNPVYIGKLRWSKDGRAASLRKYDDENIIYVDGKHEPLVSLETWQAAQDRFAQIRKAYPKYQRKEAPANFMVKGLVRCSSCGATLCQSAKKNSIQCHNYSRGTCSVSHWITLDKINAAVIEALEQSLVSNDFNIAPPKRPQLSEVNETEKLISAEYRKLQRVKAAYENGTDTLEEYSENKRKIQAQIKKLEAERPKPVALFNPKSFSKKVSSVLEIITNPNNSEQTKNEALRTIVDHITLNRPENTIDIFFHN